MRRSQDFDRVVRQGSRKGRRHLVVHCLPDSVEVPTADPSAAAQGGTTRVGFIVSRAVGGAVVRNKVKRRLRAAVTRQWEHIPAGASVVVRALPASATADSGELERDLLHGIRSACQGAVHR